MNVLIVGPLPPPVSGNALNVKTLWDHLKPLKGHAVVDLSKKQHLSGKFSMERFCQILYALDAVWRKHRRFTLVYHVIAESFLGNLRDLVIYAICYRRLDKVVIHLLGGAGIRQFFSKGTGFRFRLNQFFLNRVGGIVVEGRTQYETFARVLTHKDIHIVPNFAEDFLFTDEQQIVSNFTSADPLRILFLSNMLPGKGHFELLDAYLGLPANLQRSLRIDFAGRFAAENDEKTFMLKIKGERNILYHGSVSGDYKRRLYTQAHVFCLPTYYPYEGQPFCILEAYASGCAVITTNHSGIGEVFKHGVNGFQVEKESVASLASVLEMSTKSPNELQSMAINNLRTALEKYTRQAYLESLSSVFDSLDG